MGYSASCSVHPAEELADPYRRYGYGFAADEAQAIPFLKVLFTEDLQTSVQRFGTLVCIIYDGYYVMMLLKMIRLICLQFHNDFSCGLYYNIF